MTTKEYLESVKNEIFAYLKEFGPRTTNQIIESQFNGFDESCVKDASVQFFVNSILQSILTSKMIRRTPIINPLTGRMIYCYSVKNISHVS